MLAWHFVQNFVLKVVNTAEAGKHATRHYKLTNMVLVPFFHLWSGYKARLVPPALLHTIHLTNLRWSGYKTRSELLHTIHLTNLWCLIQWWSWWSWSWHPQWSSCVSSQEAAAWPLHCRPPPWAGREEEKITSQDHTSLTPDIPYLVLAPLCLAHPPVTCVYRAERRRWR